MRKTEQIVYNLLSNAVKFSTDRGPVIMSARRVPRHVVGQLTELHGGAVAASSVKGEGACFAAWLPLCERGLAVSSAAPGAGPIPVVTDVVQR